MSSLIVNNKKFYSVNIKLNDPSLSFKNHVEMEKIAKHPILGFFLKWLKIASKVNFTEDDKKKSVYLNTNSVASHLLERAGFAHSTKEIKAFKAKLKEEKIDLKEINAEKLMQIWEKACTGPISQTSRKYKTSTVNVEGLSGFNGEKTTLEIDSNDTVKTLSKKIVAKRNAERKDPLWWGIAVDCKILLDGKSLNDNKKLMKELNISPESNLSVNISSLK